MKTSVILFLGALGIGSAANACAWDRDTLETEAKGAPTAIKAISGRFERNPPLYYTMRFDRVTRKLENSPQKFDLYDDASVAQARLGNPREALRWIEKKRAVLPELDASNKDHWYRYFANAGTFSMQKWLMDGANRRQTADLKRARDQIRRAIEINPDAHFGREKYQLGYIEWLLNPKVNKGTTSPIFWKIDAKNAQPAKAIEGISGLVTEGLGWENVDVFRALTKALEMDNKTPLSILPSLRASELFMNGQKSHDPAFATFKPAKSPMATLNAVAEIDWRVVDSVPNPEVLVPTFQKLRNEADDWHAKRSDWMLTRLKNGQHPDTHPAFWDGYEEAAAPEFVDNDLGHRPRFSPALFALAIPLVASFLVLRRRKNRR